MRASAVFWCFVLLCTAVKVTDAEKITEDSDGGALVIDDYRESSKHGVYDENDEIDERQQDATPEGRQFTLPSISSMKQLGLFSFTRVLNAMHLLALLIGIYLMIFVVEPVPVPQHVLRPHYYGLPWSNERADFIVDRKDFVTHSSGFRPDFIVGDSVNNGLASVNIRPASISKEKYSEPLAESLKFGDNPYLKKKKDSSNIGVLQSQAKRRIYPAHHLLTE